MKTGTNTSTIIHVNRIDNIAYKKSAGRKRRAKICVNCESNKEGWCLKFSEWCGKVNYICLNIKNPYEYKPPKPKNNNVKDKKNKKAKKKAKKLSVQEIDRLARKYKIY